MISKTFLLICWLFLCVTIVPAQKVIRLYLPGSEHWKHQEKEYFSPTWTTQVITNVVNPTLTMFAPDPTGKWTTTINTQIGDMPYTYDFKADGEKLTGKAKSQFGEVEITEGKFKDDEITFVENVSLDGNAIRIDYKGKISGDEIKFTRQVGQYATEEFVAKRAK